ncbi:MAG: peptidylprolyl isomerase, partial [Candidatus Thermoplasmatota archaeon]|nr:peptidylprolyl isomerase [Candidatus Thermoplasmatota archaeon]
MRKIAVALMILFSLMVIPNSIGQNPTPTAAINMDCDSDSIEVYHLYEVNEGISYEVDFNPWINRDFECTIFNPTAYQEVVEISYLIANSPEAMTLEIDQENFTIGAGSNESFTMNLSLNEDIRYDVEPYTGYFVEITATVTEINGFPPSNVASDTSSSAIIIEEILQGSRLGFNVNPSPTQIYDGYPITGQLFNGDSWSNYDYSMLFDSETELPFSEPWNVIQFIDVDCGYCQQMADEMKIYSEIYDYNNDTNQEPNVRFLTNVADMVINGTENSTFGSSNDRNDIEDFKEYYQHNLIDYIDDLSNTNFDGWDILGIPRTYLIQPDGIFAWDPASYPYVGWSEFEHKPIILDNCVIQSSFPFLPPGSPFGPSYDCDVANAIDYLVQDTDVSPVVTMEIYHGESLENALSVHNIEIELDLNAAPIHTDNFLKHIQAGNYNGATFHRIIDDFMIQGGDFENGDGTGGYAYEWYGYCNGQAMNSSAECSNSTLYT